MATQKKSRLIDIPLLLASLAIAFVIWLMAEQGQLQTDQLAVPVEVTNVPQNVEIETEPDRIQIIVKFPQSQRSRVVAQNFAVQFDASEIFGGDPRKWAGVEKFLDKPVDVTLDHVHTIGLPQSIKATGFGSAARVHLQTKLRTLKLPVKPLLQGNPPAGFERADTPKVDPPEALFTGSFEALQKMSETIQDVTTNPINLDGRTASFVAQPGLQVPQGLEAVNDDAGKGVTVAIKISEKEITKTIADVPIKILPYNEGVKAKVRPATAQIRVTGKVSVVDQIDADAFSFAWKGELREQVGQKKEVDLVVDLSDKLTREIREKIKIEDCTPKKVEIEFVAAP